MKRYICTYTLDQFYFCSYLMCRVLTAEGANSCSDPWRSGSNPGVVWLWLKSFCAGEIQENHGGVLLGLDIFRISSQSLLIDCFTMLNRLFSYSTCNFAGNCQVATMPGSRGCAWTLSYRNFLWFCSFWAWSLRASIFWTLADERLMVVEQWKPWEIDEKSLLTMVIFHFANCNKLPKDIMISESSIYNVWTLKLTAYTCCSSLMA